MCFGEVSLKEKTKDIFFTIMLGFIILLPIFTGINSVIYNWIYLPKVYDKSYDQWSLARLDMFTGYWSWPVGKAICIINLLIFAVIFVLWGSLRFKIRQEN